MLKEFSTTKFPSIYDDIKKGKNVTISGLRKEKELPIFLCDIKKPFIYVTNSDYSLTDFADKLKKLGLNVFVYDNDYQMPLYSKSNISQPNITDKKLILTLYNLVKNNIDGLIVNSITLTEPLPAPELFEKHITVTVGKPISYKSHNYTKKGRRNKC